MQAIESAFSFLRISWGNTHLCDKIVFLPRVEVLPKSVNVFLF